MPVLWHTFFSNIKPREDFDPGSQHIFETDWRCSHFPKLTIDAKSNPIIEFIRLEMQIRGMHLDGLMQHLLQKSHCWRVVSQR